MTFSTRLRPRHGRVVCLCGRDLWIDPRVFAAYFLKPIDAVQRDLVFIAGAIAFADRAVRRQLARGWHRHLLVTIPVAAVSHWREPRVLDQLIQTANLVTGDSWEFRFEQRPKNDQIDGDFEPLPFDGRPVGVMPYSDGLDSFAAARLFSSSDSAVSLIRVTAGCHRHADREWRDGSRSLSVPFRMSEGHGVRLSEATYRSRGFVFGAISAVAATVADAHEVIVPESGQGSIGPALVPIGQEAPDVRCHPVFTHRLESFFQAALGHEIRFRHPHLWTTKGETLRALRESALHVQWHKTRSCARGRSCRLGKRTVQCGVCSACLLRRQSLQAAGLDESITERYVWPNLSAPTLETAAASGARPTNGNDKDYAVAGVRSMNDLALLAACSTSAAVEEAVADLATARNEQDGEVRNKMLRLLRVHRDEWGAFVTSLGRQSFVNRYTGGFYGQ